MYDLRRKRVWVPGHRGMVGGAILRRLREEDCTVLTASRDELELTRQNAVEDWVGKSRPQATFLAAATVGGIQDRPYVVQGTRGSVRLDLGGGRSIKKKTSG